MLLWQNDRRKIAESFAETRCLAIPLMREEMLPPFMLWDSIVCYSL